MAVDEYRAAVARITEEVADTVLQRCEESLLRRDVRRVRNFQIVDAKRRNANRKVAIVWIGRRRK